MTTTSTLANSREPDAPRVPIERLRGRLDRTRTAMREQGIDALVVVGKGLISHYGYLEYLLGFCPVVRHGYLVVTQQPETVAVMTTRSDAYFAEAVGIADEVRVAGEGDVIGTTNTTGSVLVDVLQEHGVQASRIGVVGVENIMPSRDVDALRAGLPGATITDETTLLGDIKAVKTPDEYAEVLEAGRAADVAFQAFIDTARDTKSTYEIFGEMERALRAEGARDSLIFIGRGPYFLHRPFDDEIVDGDLVSVYVEAVAANGYWVEKAGLFTYGQITDQQQAYADACVEALEAAGDAMVVGATASDVARALEAKISHLDPLTGIWHGHGVGVDHDSPVIGVSDDTVITEGMVIAVHPNLTNRAETVGASVAETFLVRDGKAQAISSLERRIRSI